MRKVLGKWAEVMKEGRKPREEKGREEEGQREKGRKSVEI